jgi:8-oxo-dGTP pyrophosphatase MutT (NUDIX family)
MMVPGGALLIGPKPALPVKREGQARHPDPGLRGQPRHPGPNAGACCRPVHDSRVTVKHSTASTFVFCPRPAGWRIALIVHPLFGRLMLPGGHVEPDESPPEAALREVAEESGLRVRLIAAAAPPIPAGLAAIRPLVDQPWWILEQPVPSDNHLAAPHIHVDHLYVAVTGDPAPATEPAHPFAWYAASQLAGLHMFPDTRLLAGALFSDIDRIAGIAGGSSDNARHRAGQPRRRARPRPAWEGIAPKR